MTTTPSADDWAGEAQALRLEYVPLPQCVEWDWEENPKEHDLGALAESIWEYGFQDPPKFDGALGRFVYGNGRAKAVQWGKLQEREPPTGVLVRASDGEWAIPVVFGNDLASKAAAEAFAIDHNNLTMAGGDFAPWDIARMWDLDSYTELLESLAAAGTLPTTVDEDALEMLLAELPIRPDFEGLVEQFAGPGEGNPKGDEKWFYVEYYGDPDRWARMQELLTPHLKKASQSFHELDSDFFFEMVEAHLG